jgi:hypothetical protein
MGRHSIPIDTRRVAELAAQDPTLSTVAGGLGVSMTTLQRRLAADDAVRGAYALGASRAVKHRTGRPLAESRRFTGTASERVVAAVAAGYRTYGRMLAPTGLTHDALVHEVQRLVRLGRLVAREAGGVRQHFLAGEV